jgi:hypothetical protein
MRMRRPATLALATAVALVACTGSPAQSPAGSASATAPPSATSVPTATPAVTAAPTVTPSPEPLVIDWTRQQTSGLDPTDSIEDVVAANGTLVLAAGIRREDTFKNGLWHSSDGRAWKAASQEADVDIVRDLAVGGPGFVAVGAAGNDVGVWLSTDGDTWERIQDDSLKNGVAQMVLVTDSGLIAFGSRSDDYDQQMIWTSEDGRVWLAATNETGRQVAAGLRAATDYDGRAVAFVQPQENGPITVWETTGRADWTQAGELPDSAEAAVSAAAGGPRGWVAVGTANETGAAVAWASDDGRTWRTTGTGPDTASDLVADDAGFVAVGYVGSLPGETCGDQRPFEMKTWTSVDGDARTLQPATDEGLASVLQAVVVDRTLLGMGIDWTTGEVMDGSGAPTAWTAPLPPIAAPATSSDKPTAPKTCGP